MFRPLSHTNARNPFYEVYEPCNYRHEILTAEKRAENGDGVLSLAPDGSTKILWMTAGLGARYVDTFYTALHTRTLDIYIYHFTTGTESKAAIRKHNHVTQGGLRDYTKTKGRSSIISK